MQSPTNNSLSLAFSQRHFDELREILTHNPSDGAAGCGRECVLLMEPAARDMELDQDVVELIAQHCSSTPYGQLHIAKAVASLIQQRAAQRALMLIPYCQVQHLINLEILEKAIDQQLFDVTQAVLPVVEADQRAVVNAILAACRVGCVKTVDYLRTQQPQRFSAHRALDHALHHRQEDVVQYLMPLCSDQDKVQVAALASSWQHWEDVLRVLSQVTTFTAGLDINQVLTNAVSDGQVEVVKIVLPHADMSLQDCFKVAIDKKQAPMFEALLDHKLPNYQIAELITRTISHNQWAMAVMLAERLAQQPTKTTPQTITKTLRAFGNYHVDPLLTERMIALLSTPTLQDFVNETSSKSSKATTHQKSLMELAQAHLTKRILVHELGEGGDDGTHFKKRKI